jgi:MFS family permease
MDALLVAPAPHRRAAVLATVCLAVLAINLDTTIVNVALPSMSRQLGAGTSTLQWVVDGYSLAFAALVLTGGSIGDRLGRRPVLVLGLVGFAGASALAGVFHSVAVLVFLRFVMGAFAALIYPTTLSIITNSYPDRRERAWAWRWARSAADCCWLTSGTDRCSWPWSLPLWSPRSRPC